jgi:hypothetical protein
MVAAVHAAGAAMGSIGLAAFAVDRKPSSRLSRHPSCAGGCHDVMGCGFGVCLAVSKIACVASRGAGTGIKLNISVGGPCCLSDRFLQQLLGLVQLEICRTDKC